MPAFNTPTAVHDGAVLAIFALGTPADADSKSYVTVGANDESVAVWTAEGGGLHDLGRFSLLEERRMYGRESRFVAACMTRSKRHVVTVTGDGIVSVRDVLSGAETARCLISDARDNVGGVAASHDDRQLFVAVGSVVHVLQLNEEATRLGLGSFVFGGHGTSGTRDSNVRCLAGSPCPPPAALLCTGHADGSIGFFAETCSSVSLPSVAPTRQATVSDPASGPEGTRACCLTLSPDGSLAAVGTSDGRALLFDVLEGRLILAYYITQSSEPVTAIEFNPMEYTMTCVSGPFIVVCDLESRRCVACDLWTGGDSVSAVAYSVDGKMLLVGTSRGKLAVASAEPTPSGMGEAAGERAKVRVVADPHDQPGAGSAAEWDACANDWDAGDWEA